ncbi:hypothetical protein A2419_01445 [Candidatus Adlerbacteria bacterium RIFOXYC1_FULL_48_26]|uniref:Type 4a pilus biogenesis protein PilO n=1 Tax=Candidatus Adlerbacteria bacterium RIFOXYC1_FULL_48_26 TaxID=1797247 RepID=A0A1F4Y2B4_9BACT|nr:MAG: hypothetical protein A2419_01445 [Candidatus Adlerbacteria bacterium RIFOXYC1_FULL_48_26]OGC93958.1 MAG: hypothetical protein A2389_00490 [Candidatus Adlerbacteria bacterium RIFOXYB1_FULL_48_10]OGC96044.1 MAG: hypothetical protein A2590_01635 [Candidatus Adlerbacteria bacterium RIFOXYD1_FULL_48_8]
MTRIILPIILLAAALGLFVMYTNPSFQSIKQLAVEQAAYDQALDKAQELRAVRDQLLSRRASFSDQDVDKLSHTLPDNLDNIRLIIDINNIASRHRASISQVQLGSTQGSGTGSSLATGPSGSSIGTVEMGFSINATYDDFLAFQEDLEHSLRILDVTRIGFSTGGDLNTYSYSIKTYWLH